MKSINRSDLLALRRSMRGCEQMPGLSVLRHGLLVWSRYAELRAHVLEGKPLANTWRLPSWVHSERLWRQQAPLSVIRTYQIYHDCGKPSVRCLDAEGKAHYPDHEEASANHWLRIGGDPRIAELMRNDMQAHRMTAEQVPAFAALPDSETLLLTALCEIHANAELFGGIQSLSFKVKYKQLDRRGKAYHLLHEPHPHKESGGLSLL